jgi:outer membrane biosynthesis protein TonB
MSQAQAVAEPDRLPWLADEAPPRPERRGNAYLWAIAAAVALAVAAAAWWLGANLIEKPVSRPTAVQAPKPQPPAAEPAVEQPQQPQVTLQPAPEVSPAPVRRVLISRPRPVQRAAAAPPKQEEVASTPAEQNPAPTENGNGAAAAPAKAQPLKLWPASQSAGAAGRIVRIGAFGSRYQAKLGWRYMVRSYPAVAHLPATVVLSRNSNGRPFYRFQIGTTSQAHSEVLCQRMDRIQLSCAVVGLPWKPKGVER